MLTFMNRMTDLCFTTVIAPGYGLDGPGIESGGGEIFCTGPDGPWGLTNFLYNGFRVFPGSKEAGARC
jgi:hypothetical protein